MSILNLWICRLDENIREAKQTYTCIHSIDISKSVSLSRLKITKAIWQKKLLADTKVWAERKLSDFISKFILLYLLTKHGISFPVLFSIFTSTWSELWGIIALICDSVAHLSISSSRTSVFRSLFISILQSRIIFNSRPGSPSPFFFCRLVFLLFFLLLYRSQYLSLHLTWCYSVT
jgi:hypothetical protein